MKHPPQLAEALAQGLELPLAELRLSALPGGDINCAWRLESAAEVYFVKTNRAALLSMFEAERLGLERIAATRAIRVPRPILTGRTATQAFIVMEYIELGHRPDAAALAAALAQMHQTRHAQFGFERDNNIGSSPQANTWADDWQHFWRYQRLEFQLDLLKSKAATRLIDDGYRLAAALPAFFSGYQARPSLLHGDLWEGNQGVDNDGHPVIFDPACYYGDHEAELAMMELFGNPGARFFAVYAERFAIDPGYDSRRDLYNLYHILNHANLFGGGYFEQAASMIRRLLAQV